MVSRSPSLGTSFLGPLVAKDSKLQKIGNTIRFLAGTILLHLLFEAESPNQEYDDFSDESEYEENRLGSWSVGVEICYRVHSPKPVSLSLRQ